MSDDIDYYVKSQCHRSLSRYLTASRIARASNTTDPCQGVRVRVSRFGSLGVKSTTLDSIHLSSLT